jgi:putative ABC transport system permease protein
LSSPRAEGCPTFLPSIAWKNLAGERTRFAISVAGVAFSVVLVLTLRGLYRGVIDEATLYVRSAGADLWVAQAGIPPDFIQATSVLPADHEADVARVPGVEEVAPLLNRSVAVVPRGKKQVDLFLVGAEPGTDIGWPRAGTAPVPPPERGELLVDRVFAKQFDVKEGDVLSSGGQQFVVADVVSGGNAFAYQLGWANRADVESLIGAEDSVSYFLVNVAPGANRSAVAEGIREEVPGTQVFTSEELADRNADNLREGFLPVLWVLMIVAFVVGTMIIGLIIYTATVEKTREYGILKAIGLSNRSLYILVFQQSLFTAVAGFVVGTGLAFLLGPAIEQLVPVFVTRIRFNDVVFVGTVTLIMAIVASFVPARPVARLDPAQVFKH